MMNFQTIEPIRPIQAIAQNTATQTNTQPTMFADILQSLVDNVKETEAVRSETNYALATGQLDNPAEASIASAQALLATQMLTQVRDRAVSAYSELMRINL